MTTPDIPKAGVDLVEMLDALHAQLAEAADRTAGHEIRFPINQVDLELQVGVTSNVEGHAGVRFWVLDAGGSAAVAAQALQTVRLTLGEPVDSEGRPVRVTRATDYRP